MNGQQALVPTFDGAEARRLTNELKRDAQALWSKLIELYEGGAHTALNYASWHEYCSAEFGFGKSHSYRLLDAGRVARQPRGCHRKSVGPASAGPFVFWDDRSGGG